MRLDRQKSLKTLYSFWSFSDFFSKMVMLISCLKAYMKWLDPLSSMQKKLAMFFWPFWKTSAKTVKKEQFFLDIFDGKVSFCQKQSIQTSSVFLCVAISASRRFIWAITEHYLMIFNFHFSKGGPFWFRGGQSATPRGWTGQIRFSKCFSWTLQHFPYI